MTVDLSTAKTPEEAQRLLSETIGKHAARLDELDKRGEGIPGRLDAFDKMAGELRQAQGELREAMQANAARDLQGPEADLRTFIEGDKLIVTGRATTDDIWRPGLLDSARTCGDWHGEFKRLYGMRTLARIARTSGTGVQGTSPKIDRALARHVALAPASIKRIFGGSGETSWIPTENLVPDLDRDLRIVSEGSLANQFPTVPMSGKVVTYPFGTTGGTPFLQGAPVADPAQYVAVNPGEDQRTHTAKTLAMRYELDRDATEDAIVDTFAEFTMQMAWDLADGEEDGIISGDATGSHGDTGIANWNPNGRWGLAAGSYGTSADHRKAWDGLRHSAIAKSNTLDMGSLQTFDGMAQLRSMLAARYGRASIGICSEKWMYLKVLTMDEVQKSDSAVGMASPDGRVLTIAGMPLFTSLFMTDDLNASGIYDDTTKTKSGLILVNRLRWKRYIRRGTMVDVAPDITRGKLDIVGTWRGTFKSNDAAATKNVAYGYNLL